MGQSTALIGFLGVLLGIMLGKGLEAALEKRRRWNREIDMVFALRAETAAGLNALKDQCKPEHEDTFMRQPYPAGPSGRADFVFQSLKGDLSLLPQAVIHQIVLYYRLAEESNILLDYLTTDAYRKLTSTRKKSFRANAMQSFKDQLQSAKQALERLESCMNNRGFDPPSQNRIVSDEGMDDRANERTDRTNHELSPKNQLGIK